MFLNCSWIFISKIAGYHGNAILTRTLDSWAWGQVVRYQMQMRSFNLFFGIQLGILVLRHADNLYSTLWYIHTCTCHIKSSKLQKWVFHHYKTWERKLVSVCFRPSKGKLDTDDTKLRKKEKFWVIMRKEKLL